MEERLQKILSAHAVASRRQAEVMISDGRVKVNGKTARLGDRADDVKDKILVDGKPLPKKSKAVYVMLYKPRGYVTTLSDEFGRKTAASLVQCGCRVYPVGRLDYASEGLLIFTNDGEMANRMMHPRNAIEKTYEVTVRGQLDTAQELLERPIVIDGYRIQPPSVKLLREGKEKATYEITIHEGRNRQIRKMCEAAGLTVLRLCRIREGALTLGDLGVGKWRYLTENEIAGLSGEERK